MKRTTALLILACAVAAFLAPAVSADTLDPGSRTQAFEMSSKALGEDRRVLVRTPIGFDASRPHAVVYVLDAEWNFEFVAAYLDYLAENEVYPPLIVTGVVNVNRNRDFEPREDPYFDDTGGAERFLSFVTGEWVPEIDRRYPTSAHRVLIGHSFGGVFTLHALFRSPESFDAYIALGTSAWIGDGVINEQAEAYFDAPANTDAFVWMAVGEGDGGPTVPSSRRLAEVFEARAPASLEWTFDVTPKTDHFKNVPSGLHDAFMALFPAWGFDAELTAAGAAGGAAGVDAWFADKARTLGWRFVPAWFDLGVAAMALQREGHEEAALAALSQLRRPHIYSTLISLGGM